MNKIIYLMGKSASGKDTIYQQLKKEFPQYKNITLYTTRPMREGEKEGREYYFIGEDQVKELEAAGKIIELRAYSTVHGIWKYLTVDDGQIDLKRGSHLVIGTLESYEKIKAYYGEEAMLPVYIQVDDGERLCRALKRERSQKTPKYAELCRRFLADEEDFSEEKIKKAGIKRRFIHQDTQNCLEEISLYIRENICYNI